MQIFGFQEIRSKRFDCDTTEIVYCEFCSQTSIFVNVGSTTTEFHDRALFSFRQTQKQNMENYFFFNHLNPHVAGEIQEIVSLEVLHELS